MCRLQEVRPPAHGTKRGGQQPEVPPESLAKKTKEGGDVGFDTVFLQCPLWTMYKPDAYNRSKSKQSRDGRLVQTHVTACDGM